MTVNRDGLVAEIRRIDAEMDRLKSARAIATAMLTEGETTGGTKVTESGARYVLRENAVYSDAAMVGALRKGQFQRASKRVLDRAKVKALYPEVYANAKSVRGFAVSVPR